MGYQSQGALRNDLTQPDSRGVLLKVLFSFGKTETRRPTGFMSSCIPFTSTRRKLITLYDTTANQIKSILLPTFQHQHG